MELKLGTKFIETLLKMSFNRTFMELKLCSIISSRASFGSFNRTFMELKQLNEFFAKPTEVLF